jgi:hypothetical protein
MVTLLESKLNSLPEEVTSKYPPLQHVSLNDINPEIVPIMYNQSQARKSIKNVSAEQEQNQLNQSNQQEENPPIQEEKKEEVVEETNEQKLRRFIDENNPEEMETFYKMLKMGIPEPAVLQKAKFNKFPENLVQELINLWQKVKPAF